MKALNQIEVEAIVQNLNESLYTYQLQDVVVNERGLALGFHGAGQMKWLVCDMIPNTPFLVLKSEKCPLRKSDKSKPVGLFLSSHGKGKFFHAANVLSEYGRVVSLILKGGVDELEIEVRLIPRQANLLVRSQGRQVAWDKPLPLSAAPEIEGELLARSAKEIFQEWEAFYQQAVRGNVTQDPRVQWEKQKEKDLGKKRKALGEIEKQIASQESQIWYEVGLQLKTHGGFDIEPSLKVYLDEAQSLSWNIENAFGKAKQLNAKKIGAQQRLEQIKNEIQKLEKTSFAEKVKKPALQDLMKKTEARGRKLHLESGGVVYLGKSGADNLALLRQAKAWDYWVHLRDFPGAHAIIHRHRDQLISVAELQKVAQWVAKESLATKSLSLGQKLEVIYVECRFVKPIKGDKLGRVNYHSEKSVLIRLDEE